MTIVHRARRMRRGLTLLCAVALLTALSPVHPVVAVEDPPETKAESLGVLEEEGDEVADDEVADGDDEAGRDDEATAGSDQDGNDAGEADDVADEADGTDDTDEVVGDPDEWRTSKVAQAPIPFTALGITAPDGADVQVRTGRDGAWSNWEPLEAMAAEDGPDPGSGEARDAEAFEQDGRWASYLLWVSEADEAQFMVQGAELDELEVEVIDSMGLSESLFERVSRRARAQVRPAGAEAFPGIRTRRDWGADESWRSGDPRYATPRFSVLHHTATRNEYTREEAPGIVRAIYRFHTQNRGWSDIGYNFLVDRYGTVYEGRAGGITRGVIGAHASGYNTGSFGVSLIGNFELEAPPRGMVNKAVEVIAWKYNVHDIDPNPARMVFTGNRWVNTLSGHRDVGSTACPGRHLYAQMDDIRHAVFVASANFGTPPTPVVGDWNGDGRYTIGWFRNGQWVLRNANSSGSPSVRVNFGTAGDLPVVGDWNGDGRTNIGVVRNGRWLLKTSHSGGNADIDFHYGRARDYPLPGDWNGDGRHGPGIVRDGAWHLRNRLSGGNGDIVFHYGRVTRGDIPVVGDFNGNGRFTPAILRDGEWHLRDSLAGGPGDYVFVYGRVTKGDLPIVGDWNRSGRFGVGVTRGGNWYLRNALSGGNAQISFSFPFQ